MNEMFPNKKPDEFIRQNWAGGIGNPDVTAENILDVIDSIDRCTLDEFPYQSHALLEYEDDYVLWVSGSRHGALLWVKEGCYGFDFGTTANLAEWADLGVFKVSCPAGRAAIAWGNFLLGNWCRDWRVNRGRN